MKKTTFLLFMLFLFVGFSNAQKNQNAAREQYSRVSYKIVANGETSYAIKNSGFIPGVKSILKNPGKDNYPLYNATFVYTGCSTIYDFSSNATPQNIVQDANNPDRIHTVWMYAPPGDGTSAPNRRTKYYYSTNRGTTWTYVCNVPDVRGGFGAITLMPNGTALVSENTSFGGNYNKAQWFVDAFPGLGSFTNLVHTQITDYVWPRSVSTNSITNTNKFVTNFAATGRDSAFWASCTSISQSPGVFSPINFYFSDQSECYSIARGSDGRIGILYIVNGVLLPNEYASVFFMESTDHGTSFGTPIKIFSANISPSGEGLGALRGIQLVYQGTSPKAIFETCNQTVSSYYSNDGKNNIRFWSNSLPGSDPNRSIIIADTARVGYHPLINTGTNSDIYTCICRPTIGASADGTGLFVAFMVPSNYTGGAVDTVSFMDVWLTYSTNYGSNWISPSKINPVSPIRDWTFPCISSVNDNASNYYYVNMAMLSDSTPGSYLYHANGESSAKCMFARVEIPRTVATPEAPTLIYPPNGAIGVSQPITFDWSDVPTATSYRLQISLNSSFTQIVVDENGISNSQYTLTNILGQAATHYWRVNASNSAGTGPWSSVWIFMTGLGTVPPAPALLYPPNGTTCVSVTPTFDWQNVIGALSYRIQVSTSPTFATTIINVAGISQSQYTVGSGILLTNTQYYWRVNATNSSGTGDWSNTLIFTTAPALPAAPTLIAPPNGVTNVSLTPMLYWNISPGATSYRVVVSMSSSFTTMIFDSTVTTVQVTIPSGRLNNMTVYYWRVNAINCAGNSNWSSPWVFVTGPTDIQTYSSEIPTEYKLHNNFPNPFNPVTKIRFDLPKTSGVKLKVFDLLGKEIATLVNDKLPPGRYETEFSIDDVKSTISSGIYFYKLETENFVSVKKLVLIK